MSFYDEGFDWRKGPEPGDGATHNIRSDSYPYTIINISSERMSFTMTNPDDRSLKEEVSWPKWIEVTRDDYKGVSGDFHQGNVEYEYFSNAMAEATRYILKDGQYRKATEKWDPVLKKYRLLNSTTQNAQTVSVGYRKFYNDPSF